MVGLADRAPLALDKVGQLVPLAERVQAAHFAKDDLAVLLALERLAVKGLVRLLPAIQLEVPALVLELRVIKLLVLVPGKSQNAPGGILLLELAVNVDECLNDVGRGVGKPLELLVVERLGKGAMLQCLGSLKRVSSLARPTKEARKSVAHVLAEHLGVKRQNLVVVLGKLAQIEEHVDDLGRAVGRRDGRRD